MFKDESILKRFYYNYINKFQVPTYSQEGEDRILSRIFEDRKKGFYVDIGAHHPFRFSNTYLFYKRNWNGINIDANPDCISLFNKFRPKDVNINVGISNSETTLVFYKFNEPALNTFDSNLAKTRMSEGWDIDSEIEVKLTTLKNIFDEKLSENQKIDFMSIDVEGFDLQVLKSNNWDKYRPEYLLVECLGTEMSTLNENEIYSYLQSIGYSFFGRAVNTYFFRDKLV